MTTPATLSVPAFAEHIGCKRHYGYELKKDGRLVMAPDGKQVLVAESIARIAATRDPSKQGVAERHAQARGAAAATGHQVDEDDSADTADAADLPATAGGLYNFQDSKAKREHYAAEREHDQYLKDAGELSERKQVMAVFADAGTTLRSKLEAWQATLPPQLAGRDEAAIRITLADQTERILHELVAVFTKWADSAKAD